MFLSGAECSIENANTIILKVSLNPTRTRKNLKIGFCSFSLYLLKILGENNQVAWICG